MGRALGLDWGDAQIGVAISDEMKTLARGLPTVRVKGKGPLLRLLGDTIRRLEVDEIVVGLPKNMNGTIGGQAEKALAFSQELQDLFGLPVRTWDERLTTIAAKRTLIDSGAKRSHRGREAIDRVSAVLILQSYLDSLHLQGHRPKGIDESEGED